MRVQPIYAGNRIYNLNRFDSLTKKRFINFYTQSRKSYRILVINSLRPDKFYIYRMKEISKDVVEHIRDISDKLRKQTFPRGNYIGLGNLVNGYA